MEYSIALVTGATSGLGYAAARMLASEGCAVIRSPDAAFLMFAEGMFKVSTEKGKAGA